MRLEPAINGEIEHAKESARKAFEEGAPSVEPLTLSGGSLPAAAKELAFHIPPAVRDDAVIQKQFNHYAAQESMKAEARARLSAVQTDLDYGQGDPVMLNAEKEHLANQLSQIETNQQTEKAEIRKRVADLGVQWVESPSPETVGDKKTE